ncbi:MAG: hypothetical protein J5657_02245 [Clostridiales bacterium]|nr:hypothetical protein [Clostridiales bacterium]
MKELGSLVRRYNSLNTVKLGAAVLILFSVFLILVSVIHEPWYDEAQAWQIARCASYYDIIFHIPHYESHPPLWHLILSVPAKLGAPYEISIKLINIIFSILGVFLIEIRSKFSNWTKTFVPFTFFIFYQYGIISRPYSMMLLALLLAALFYGGKDEKPLRFIASLIFLCFTSDYGLMIAGGITLAWLSELLIRHGKMFFKELFLTKKTRLAGLVILLLTAIFIIIQVYPAPDMGKVTDSPVLYNLFMITLAGPAEAFMTDLLTGDLSGAGINGIPGTVVVVLVSLLLWGIGILASYRRSALMDFLLPSAFFIAMGTIYSTPHHYGIYVMLFLYFFWILGEKPVTRKVFPGIKRGRFTRACRISARAVMAISILISCYWTFSAVINDAAYPYFFSREMASWLRDNTDEKDVIMASWCPVYEKDSQGNDITGKPKAVIYNSVAEIAVPLDPYFVRPLIDNEILPYQFLGKMNEEEIRDYSDRVKETGVPDYILTYNESFIPGFLAAIDSGEERYEMEQAFINYRIFKDDLYYYNVMVYKRVEE